MLDLSIFYAVLGCLQLKTASTLDKLVVNVTSTLHPAQRLNAAFLARGCAWTVASLRTQASAHGKAKMGREGRRPRRIQCCPAAGCPGFARPLVTVPNEYFQAQLHETWSGLSEQEYKDDDKDRNIMDTHRALVRASLKELIQLFTSEASVFTHAFSSA